MKVQHEAYRLYAQGCCQSHVVRFNQDEDTWQHMPPSSKGVFLNVTKQSAALVILHGGTIMPYRRPSWMRPPSPSKM